MRRQARRVARTSPPSTPEATAASRVHLVVSTVSTIVLFPCPFLLWLVTRDDAQWRLVARFGLIMQVPAIVAGIALGLTWLHITDCRGLIERSLCAVYYIWIVGVALKLREMDSP